MSCRLWCLVTKIGRGFPDVRRVDSFTIRLLVLVPRDVANNALGRDP